MPAHRGWSVQPPWVRALWHADLRRQYVSLGICLRAEDPEPTLTFHSWPSSRFGNCCRATRLFCRYATSISSYRALPALSSEPESQLLIRHCVPPALQSLSRRLHPSLRCFPPSQSGRAAVRPSRRSPRDRADSGAGSPSPHSRRGDRHPARLASEPRARGAHPSGLRRALRVQGSRDASRASLESSRVPVIAAVDPSLLPDFREFSCAGRPAWKLRRLRLQRLSRIHRSGRGVSFL